MAKRIIIILTFLFVLFFSIYELNPYSFRLLKISNKYINVKIVDKKTEKIISLPLGSKFNDLHINNPTVSADYVLGDNDVYYVDEINENKVSINDGGIVDLITLPGIGEKIAQNIIDYRNKYGSFENIDEIKSVKGIGDKKYEKIKELIIL